MNIFQIIGIILITLFYLFYLGKQFLLKQKGITSNRLSRGNKPQKTYRIELILLIITFTMPILQYLSIIFPGHIPFSFHAPVYLQIAGLIVALLGNIFFMLAIVTMKDSWRAGVDSTQKTNIITSGIYRYSRNPAFVGFNLLYIGTCLIVPNILLICLTVSAMLFFHLQILEEEKFLPSVFREEYTNYKKKVRRYF